MLFPILPNLNYPTCPQHNPVTPCQPLPWADCCISGLVRIHDRCETDWVEATDGFTAPYQITLRAVRTSGQIARDVTEVTQAQRILRLKECDTDDILSDRTIALLCNPREMDDKFVFKCLTDLSTVDVINHPDELFRESAKFERLKATLEHERKRRQIEDARRIDEEYFAGMRPATLQSPPSKFARKPGAALMKLLSDKLCKATPEWI
ncbi:hypothetical protein D9758_000968 [Tetrapyrgos nigripes]|uniref:Uncharacterized protein n=1 Tax=Tetrapyrgos nigripes TaxID=182062 RepID=A0A8H5LY28_9AGAR|nr:hypothetical protein D9758_000968 [Tetrapyrgos nigripes]